MGGTGVAARRALRVLSTWIRDACAPLLGRILSYYVREPFRSRYFRLWERHGFRVSPVQFYEPMPDTRHLPEALWERESELASVDMREEEQLRLLREVFSRFRDEYEGIPREPPADPARFHLENGFFTGADALVYWAMVRHFRPRRIVEVGAGFSSRLAAEACLRNGSGELTCIEPRPDPVLRTLPGTTLLETPVQEVPLSFFDRLHQDDILFIDSSHVVRTGGDVNHLLLEVMPRLNPGVIVHLHDIALPREYSRYWILDRHRFFTEQYLLQAFLAFNAAFEVLFANSYLWLRHRREVEALFPISSELGASSFWMRRGRRPGPSDEPRARERG